MYLGGKCTIMEVECYVIGHKNLVVSLHSKSASFQKVIFNVPTLYILNTWPSISNELGRIVYMDFHCSEGY